VEVEVRYHNEEVFGFGDGEWDELRLKYLFASLPFEASEQFIRSVAITSEHLRIASEFRGQITDALRLRKDFEEIRADLVSAIGDEPGSESLAILIQSTYPRRPS